MSKSDSKRTAKSASKSKKNTSMEKFSENKLHIGDIYYENITICLIDQIDALSNNITEVQKGKCRIRYARIYYLLKALKLNDSKFTKSEKNKMGWPPEELIKLSEKLSENTINQNKKMYESVDIKYEKEKNIAKKSRKNITKLARIKSKVSMKAANAEFHGPMSHPYNKTRNKSNVKYITEIITQLSKKLKHKFVIMGGAAIEKWISIIDPKIYIKFVLLYPTEDVDTNLIFDSEFNRTEWQSITSKYIKTIEKVLIKHDKTDKLHFDSGSKYKKKSLPRAKSKVSFKKQFPYEIKTKQETHSDMENKIISETAEIKYLVGTENYGFYIHFNIELVSKSFNFTVSKTENNKSKILIDGHFKHEISYNKRYGRLDKIVSIVKEPDMVLSQKSNSNYKSKPLWFYVKKYVLNKNLFVKV